MTTHHDPSDEERECCMERGCLLPQSCAQRGYCRLDRDNQRAERRMTTTNPKP